MRLPKLYKPVIKSKQVSHSETMFPTLYKKKKVVYDDFSKIYLTNIKDIKEGSPEMTIENTKENDNERSHNLKYLNSTYIGKEQNEASNTTSPHNVFARDTMNNRFMYSFKSNQSKRQTMFNVGSAYSSGSVPKIRKNNDLNIGYDSVDKLKIMANFIPNI